MSRFDAVLLVSFGGPEALADVQPFLETVTAGRGVPAERLAEVAKQYEAFGGKSQINDQNRELRAALESALNRDRPDGQHQRVYWGNRNWSPYLVDALSEMRSDGVQRTACIVTSGYSSYSGCRQYRENLFDAQVELLAEGSGGPELSKIRRWFDQPEFIEVMAENTVAAIRGLTTATSPRLLFTTHSLPTSMANTSGDPVGGTDAYVRQHEFVAQQVADQVSRSTGVDCEWELVFQSRSGPPAMPWLTPDINDRLAELKTDGETSVVIVPIGFVSDHMEVMWDLDTVAVATAESLGLEVARAATVGVDPRFVNALVRMIREREADTPQSEQVSCSPWGAAPDLCPAGCCPNPRSARPALFGAGGLDD